MEKVRQSSFASRSLFWGLWYWKRFWLRRGSAAPIADKLVFGKIQAQTGGRINEWVIGGAALDPWIHEFMMYALGCGFRVGYGASELGSGNVVNPYDIRACVPGTCGGPLPNTELMLEPIQDYDDPECGEILAGGQMLCSGYLFDEEQTQKLFVDASRKWVRTGDIGKWDEHNYLKIVDRIRSVFKLAQGEYVAAEMVTQAYEDCRFISQLFVYGDSTKTYLVGIVVPRAEAVASFLGKDRINEEEFGEACRSDGLRQAIMSEMDATAAAKRLFEFQCVKAIHVDSRAWTPDNDLLTPTFKIRRRALAEYYKTQIDALYAQTDTR
jgi:long-chain acyl-CoA synthetase